MRFLRILSLFLFILPCMTHAQKKKTLVRYAKQVNLFKSISWYRKIVCYSKLAAEEKRMRREDPGKYGAYIGLAYTTMEDLPITAEGIMARAGAAVAMQDDLKQRVGYQR